MANLVLNGKSIDSIDDIAENFVEEDVLREFRSGSRASWLEEYGYEEELERVRSIKPTASNIRVLAGISEALNLDDDVIAAAAERRAEQQRKEEAARKAREEQQRKDEESRQRREREEQEGRGNVPQQECGKEQSTVDDHNGLPDIDKVPNRKEVVALQDDANSQYDLGTQHLSNSDYKEAERCYRNAANMGHVEAQCSLGMLCQLGMGGRADYLEAVKWLYKAAAQGLARAQYELGMCYVKGLGVPQSPKKALEWFHQAAQQGYALAEKMIQHVEKMIQHVDSAVDRLWIDPERCVGCGCCKDSCPADAITEGTPYAIDTDKCVTCGSCAASCPNEAISAVSKDDDAVEGADNFHNSYERFYIDSDKCVACGACAATCPNDAIATTGSEPGATYAINKEICVDCGCCKDACPAEAIYESREY